MVDIIVKVLEEHSLNLSEEVAQAIASDITNALADNGHSLWSDDARGFFEEVLPILKKNKEAMKEDTVERTELSNLIYKIEEQIIK